MTITAKEAAKRVIERLPEQAGWDDIMGLHSNVALGS